MLAQLRIPEGKVPENEFLGRMFREVTFRVPFSFRRYEVAGGRFPRTHPVASVTGQESPFEVSYFAGILPIDGPGVQ